MMISLVNHLFLNRVEFSTIVALQCGNGSGNTAIANNLCLSETHNDTKYQVINTYDNSHRSNETKLHSVTLKHLKQITKNSP